MSTFKNLFTTSLCVLTLGLSSQTLGEESTPIAQINGEDVALPADTVIASRSYGSDLKGKLLDSGIAFMLMERSDGTTALTLFDDEGLATACDLDLSSVTRLRLNYDEVSCK